MVIILSSSINDWFKHQLSNVRCSDEAKAYITNVMVENLKSREPTMDGQSVVLAYKRATDTGRFETFQMLGDWTLWTSVNAPYPEKGERDLVETCGRLSYCSCHRIMMGRWRLYEELADEMPSIVNDVRRHVILKRR